MKIEYRLPSKNVQYGYVNVEGTAEELAELNFYSLGMQYIASVQNFWMGEIDQVDNAIALEKGELATPVEPKAFDLKDEATEPAAELKGERGVASEKPKRKVETVTPVDKFQEAAEAVVAGDAVKAEALIVEVLGATKLGEDVYDAPTEEAPKPWAAPSAFDFDN